MNVFEVVDIDDSMLNGKLYNGSEKKFGVTIDGVDYIMKFQKKNWHNIYCEYIASNIITLLGGNAHETYLGTYKGEVVVLCRDFLQDSKEYLFQSLRSVSSSLFDTDKNSYDYYFEDVLHLFEKLKYCNIDNCKDAFCEMFIYDALLGNTDRHPGNWGLICSDDTWRFSPIFDNGADLFPRASLANITEDWMRERVYVWPNSKVMFNRTRERTSYFKVLQENSMLQSYKNIIKDDLIDLAFIFIDNAPIPKDLKSLYRTVLYYRYHCVIKGEKFVWEGIK